MNFELQGKVAIVTGARTGIGQAIAVSLARSGANIVGVGHQPMPETQAQVEALGCRFLYLDADLTKPVVSELDALVAASVEAFGRVDILVNNAGIIRREDSINFSEKDWDDVMNINVKAMFFLSQSAAKQMIAQGEGGKILNIASLLSFQGGIRVPSYTTSKSGVMGLTRLLGNEWAKYNINVNAIAPGYIDTNNTEALRNDPARSAEILGRIPAGRWGDPNDIGEPAAFLCSSASNYIQGYTLAVDGGWLGR